jgi:predicted O-methyltransferase YrrM
MTGGTNPQLEPYLASLRPVTVEVVREMYCADSLVGADGKRTTLSKNVRIDPAQGAALHELISTARVKSSLEIGLAYGFSTAWILDALSRVPGASHVAIDPFQRTAYGEIGLETARRVDSAASFEFIEERSDFVLASMAKEKKLFDFIYIDGNHRFDDVIVDFYLSDRVLAVGGIVVFDDMWMRSIQSVVSFVEKNRCYKSIFTNVANIAVFKKLSIDDRDWTHFVPFEGRPRFANLKRRLVAKALRLFR